MIELGIQQNYDKKNIKKYQLYIYIYRIYYLI